MEKAKIYKNPITLFRGSSISKDWYSRIKVNYNGIEKVIEEIKVISNEIEFKIEEINEKIEKIFYITKENYYINLKRDIYNKRKEKITKSINKIEDYDLKVEIEKFNELLKKEQSLIKCSEDLFYDIYNKDRQVLKENILNNEDILKSIIFMNEDIYDKLDKFIEIPTKDHDSKLRKIDYFLLKMLIRGSMKTSPFSYLTKTGIVSNDKLEQINEKSYVEINHSIILEILHNYLRNDKDALSNLPVKVEAFVFRDSKISYISQMSVKESQKIFETSDKLVEFCLNENLITFLINKKGQIIYFKDFYEKLKELDIYENNEFTLFKKLVSLKLFKQVVDIPEERDFIKKVITFLSNNNLGEDIIWKLQQLDEEVKRFKVNDYKNRRKNWLNIKGILKNILPEDTRLGNEFLFEDIVFQKPEQKSIEEKIDKEYLYAMKDFVLLFDVNIRIQYELAKRFYVKYGNQSVNLGNSIMLNEIFFANISNFYAYYSDQYYCYKYALAEEVRILDKLRLEFLNEFIEYIKGGNCEEIELKHLILKYSNLIPEHIKENSEISYTIFLQDTKNDKVIVNDIYDGHEKFLSRFKDFFKSYESSEEYLEYVNKVFNEKNYYEISEVFGFNGGVHERKNHKKVNLGIGYQEFINKNCHNIMDFSVNYNSLTKKLNFMDNDNKNFGVIYKSSLIPIFLPGILSSMLYMFQSGRLNFTTTSLFKDSLFVPRIKFNNMIISRKKWNIDINVLKNIINNNKDMFLQYKNIIGYLRENNIPSIFFLKHYRDGKQIQIEKPMFFDLQSPLLFKFFINEISSHIKKNKKIYIEEILPEIDYELNEYMYEYTFDQKESDQ